MRKYKIEITDSNNEPFFKGFGSGRGAYLFDGTFSSTYDFGNLTNPNALNVEFDIPVGFYNAPMGDASIRVWGVGLPMISEATDFNPSPSDVTKYFNISVSAGMAENSLPLANSKQFGEILKGRILQSYGNWQGTAQTLDFIVGMPSGSTKNPLNFQFQCKKSEPYSTAILNTLKIAFKGIVDEQNIKININEDLKPSEDETHSCDSLAEFNRWINNRSKNIIKRPNYIGVSIAYQNGSISVVDSTNILDQKTHQINFSDLIGQPTWIGSQTMSLRVVMRGDIKVGDVIQMPKLEGNQINLVLSNPNSYSQYRNKSAFSDKFWITSLRHTGNFRQGSADNWVTTITAISLLPYTT